MRITSLFAIVTLLTLQNASAQNRKTFKIQPGEKVVDMIPAEDKYMYAAFTDGNVYFRQNTFSKTKLNYNFLYGEMQFIDASGDTLSLSDEETIKLIVVKNDSFIYNKGYLKLIKDYEDVKIFNKSFFTFVNRQKIGAFGEVSSASVETYNSISGSSYFKELVAKEILTIGKNNLYFISDKFFNVKPFNKKGLLELRPKDEEKIKAYLKTNKVDFNNPDDMVKLLEAIIIQSQH